MNTNNHSILKSNVFFFPLCIALFSVWVAPNTYAQDFTITKVIDNGLYTTNQGDTIQLYGIILPSVNDTAQYNAEVLSATFSWITDYLEDRKFTVKFIETISPGKYSVNMYKQRLASSANIAELFLSYGFAYIDSFSNDPYVMKMLEVQQKAINDRVGIWKISPLIPKEYINNPVTMEDYLITHRINYPNLFLGIISGVLAFDCFSQTSNIADVRKLISNSSKSNTSALESLETRYIMLGVLFTAATVVFVLNIFETFKVSTDLQSVSLKVNF